MSVTDETGVATLLDGIYRRVMVTITKQHITAGDILNIASMAMILVQKLSLPGSTKKQMVIDVVRMIVARSGLVEAKDMEAVNFYIDELLPPAIETLLEAYKNRDSAFSSSCMKKLMCCK